MANPNRRPIEMPNIRPKNGGVRLVPVQDLSDLHKLLVFMLGIQLMSLAFQVAIYASS